MVINECHIVVATCKRCCLVGPHTFECIVSSGLPLTFIYFENACLDCFPNQHDSQTFYILVILKFGSLVMISCVYIDFSLCGFTYTICLCHMSTSAITLAPCAYMAIHAFGMFTFIVNILPFLLPLATNLHLFLKSSTKQTCSLNHT